MVPDCDTQITKRKRMLAEGGCEMVLRLAVCYAEGIDKETTDPSGDRRLYRVFGWVIPGYEFRTLVVEGLPNPTWNEEYCLPLGKFMCGSYLNLEVVRAMCKSDPGTSTGIALVGRTRIPLPKAIDLRQSGRYGLVTPKGSGGIAEGHISVTMELNRVEPANFFRY